MNRPAATTAKPTAPKRNRSKSLCRGTRRRRKGGPDKFDRAQYREAIGKLIGILDDEKLVASMRPPRKTKKWARRSFRDPGQSSIFGDLFAWRMDSACWPK